MLNEKKVFFVFFFADSYCSKKVYSNQSLKQLFHCLRHVSAVYLVLCQLSLGIIREMEDSVVEELVCFLCRES